MGIIFSNPGLLGTYQPASIMRWENGVFLMALEYCKLNQTVMIYLELKRSIFRRTNERMFIPATKSHTLG